MVRHRYASHPTNSVVERDSKKSPHRPLQGAQMQIEHQTRASGHATHTAALMIFPAATDCLSPSAQPIEEVIDRETDDGALEGDVLVPVT